jgi:hypothetical protein
VWNGQQVGAADGRAGIWNGTPASFVELFPYESLALAIHEDEQVGWIALNDLNAVLWRGTASSLVDLNPAGASASSANAVFDGVQVGSAKFNGRTKAGLWTGSSESWEDLSVFLPGAWGDSVATGVWNDGTTLYVVGYGFRDAVARYEALLWTRPLQSTCYPDCDGSGTLDVFDFLCFQDLFVAGDPSADCDGSGNLDVFDFLCFQDAFVAGCG